MEWAREEADTVCPGAPAADRTTEADHEDHRGQRDLAGRRDRGTTAERGEVLGEAGRRSAEQVAYRARVDQTYEAARGTVTSDAVASDGETSDGETSDAWGEAVPELRGSWEILKEKYAYRERVEPTPQAEGGAWRGKGGRGLDAAQNTEIDLGYARIREVGENVIVPGILRVAAEDQSRALAGFDRRIKGEDRLKEKVADLLDPPSKLTAAESLSAIVDVVRFTYTYHETRYANGVLTDVERLKAQGFELDKLKNTWDSEQYKGVNTQWLEPQSGVRFEVQFHTPASREAKELTHEAYERIRSITEQTPETERESAELEAFQSEANAKVPIPPDIRAIEDYRREKRDG